MADRKVTFLIGANTTQFKKGLKSARKSLNGFAKSMKSIGRTASISMTAPLVAGAFKSVQAFDKQAKAIAQVEQGLKSTGNVAGFTSKELQKMASDLQKKTLFGDEEILQGATAQLLTFTNITGEQFERTQQAALDLATRLDGDLKSASIQLGKALNDPVANLSALSRSGIQFSASQKEVIKEMATTGRLAEAQTLILNELNKQYGGSAEAAVSGAGAFKQLSNSIGDLQEQFGEILVEYLTPMVKKLQEVVEKFQMLDKDSRERVVKLGIALAAIGPAILAIGTAVTALSALLSPVGLALISIAATLLLIVTNLQQMMMNIREGIKVWDMFINQVKLKLSNFFSGILSLWEKFFQGMSRLPFMENAFDNAISSLQMYKKGFEDVARASKASIQATKIDFKSRADASQELLDKLQDIKNEYLGIFNMSSGTGSSSGGSGETSSAGATASTASIGSNPTTAFSGFDLYGLDPMKLREVNTQLKDMKHLTNAQKNVMMVLTDVSNTFTNSFGTGMANVIVAGEKLTDVLRNIGKLLLSSAIQKGLSILLTGGLSGTGLFGSGGGLIGGLFKGIGIPGFAKGGIVPSGFPNDTYPALLTSGEAVIPKGHPLPSGSMELVVNLDSVEIQRGQIELNNIFNR